MADSKKPFLLFTCGREPQYTRNHVLLACLESHFKVDTVVDSSRFLPWRYLRLFWQLMWRKKHTDATVVGFYGQPLMLLPHFFIHQPILFDAFISTYDTLCFDRQRYRPASIVGRLAFWIDRISCSRADRVLFDTHAHADYFSQTFGIPREKQEVLFVGCDENLFHPENQNLPVEQGLVLSYSSYLPLHGNEIILRAAKELQNEPAIRFKLIGDGMQAARMRSLAKEWKLENIEFFPPVPLDALPAEIARANICLGGHFGASEKARRVIAGKTFQMICMAKATIVGDNPANHELLTHGQDAWFVPMNDPGSLAEAIRFLVKNPKIIENLGLNARQTFLNYASLDVLKDQMKAIINRLVN